MATRQAAVRRTEEAAEQSAQKAYEKAKTGSDWYAWLARRPAREGRSRRTGSRSGRSAGRPVREEQGRQDSNLQPPVLETGALPVELRP